MLWKISDYSTTSHLCLCTTEKQRVPPPTLWTAPPSTTKLEIWLPISRFVSDLDKHMEICVWQYWGPMLQVNHAIYSTFTAKWDFFYHRPVLPVYWWFMKATRTDRKGFQFHPWSVALYQIVNEIRGPAHSLISERVSICYIYKDFRRCEVVMLGKKSTCISQCILNLVFPL